MKQPTAMDGLWVITAQEIDGKPGRLRCETPLASEADELITWLEAHPRWTNVEFTFGGILTGPPE